MEKVSYRSGGRKTFSLVMTISPQPGSEGNSSSYRSPYTVSEWSTPPKSDSNKLHSPGRG
jgi:hypothetical protein